MYCTDCNINWMHLHSQEDGGEETIEFCPKCKNDLNLIQGKDGDAFVMCAFTGRIYNPVTQQEYKAPITEINTAIIEPFDKDQWRESKEDLERTQIERIDKYIAESETIGEEKARQNYLNRV